MFRRSLWNTFLYVAIVLPGAVGSRAAGRDPRARPQAHALVLRGHLLPAGDLDADRDGDRVAVPAASASSARSTRLLRRDRASTRIAFLSEPALVLPTLAVIGIWQLVGFNMVLFLAGLSAIPRDLYEAAEIDGCANADRSLPHDHLAAARADDDVRHRHDVDHRVQGVRHRRGDDARRPDGRVGGAALLDLPRRLPVLPHRATRRR